MARRKEPDDAALTAAIAETVYGRVPEGEADALAADLLARLAPLVGAAAQRRRTESVLMGVFREGFRSGQATGRFTPWHSARWRGSTSLRETREAARAKRGGDEGRYSRYNFD